MCIVCTHKVGGDRFQLGDVVQCAGVFDVSFCSVVHSSLCLLGQHYLVTSLKFMVLVLRVHPFQLAIQPHLPLALMGLFVTQLVNPVLSCIMFVRIPKGQKLFHLTVKLIVSPIDS